MPLHYTSLDQLTAPYAHVVLSPHLDDAALSCGGLIAGLAAAGFHVLVVNICSGSPPPGTAFSPFATELHERWGLPAAEAVSLRIREDALALETLGADCYQLAFLDAIYRLPEAYDNEAALFGPIAPADSLAACLQPRLEALASHLPGAIFYAPLGVGNHVDHQAAYIAATTIAQAGVNIAFYEDVPYVIPPGALETRFEALGGAAPSLSLITAIDAALTRKIAAIEAYRSQIEALFGDATRMARTVTDYAERVRPETASYGERLWIRQ